jgi:hypothetical protein
MSGPHTIAATIAAIHTHDIGSGSVGGSTLMDDLHDILCRF